MPRKSPFDEVRMNRILAEQYLVITRSQVLACGMSSRALHPRVASSGPWQRLLPGVYLTVTGKATQEQREMAALLYSGPESMITGVAAARRHHLRPPGPDVVDLLIPWTQRCQSTSYVRVHRTRRMPERVFATGKVRFTEAPRAVADAARSMTRFDDVRAVVCEAIQRRACTLDELAAELAAGPSAGSGLLRAALAEVADGVRSVAEADFRTLILRSDLPRPVFNARLIDVDGTLIAVTDAWWQEAGVAAEIDSLAYHLSAADQDRTTDRHDKLTGYGILALHFSPKRVKDDPVGVLRAIRQTIAKGLERPPLPIKGLPPDDSGSLARRPGPRAGTGSGTDSRLPAGAGTIPGRWSAARRRPPRRPAAAPGRVPAAPG
jgi:hypothetical protein